MGKQAERFESEFNYHSMIPKPATQPYLSPVFQNELKEITQKHLIEPKGYGASAEQNLLHARAILENESSSRSKTRPVFLNNGRGILGINNDQSHEISISSASVSIDC
jgi:hypothetical protein